jgi:hypothetical protein
MESLMSVVFKAQIYEEILNDLCKTKRRWVDNIKMDLR